MCAHSTLETKDFIAPLAALFGTVLVAAMTYYGIFIKLNKDRRMKWLDEFRKEVANVIFILRAIDHLIASNSKATNSSEMKKLVSDLQLSLIIIDLYLTKENKTHGQLRAKINEAMLTIKNENSDFKKIDEIVMQVTSLAREVIYNETTQVESISTPFGQI